MRLHPLSEHIEFHLPERRFCENVLPTAALQVIRQIGGGGISKYHESAETLQNKTLLDRFAKKA